METEIKGKKIIYKFNIKKLENGGLFEFGKYGKFSTPDSDGDKLDKIIENIKDKEQVTVTVTADYIKPPTYRIGQRFRHSDYKDIYILAAVADGKRVNLINTRSGTRWTQSMTVKSLSFITEEEMIKLTGTYGENFKDNFELIKE